MLFCWEELTLKVLAFSLYRFRWSGLLGLDTLYFDSTFIKVTGEKSTVVITGFIYNVLHIIPIAIKNSKASITSLCPTLESYKDDRENNYN